MGAIKDKIAGTVKQVEGKLTGDRVRSAQGTVQKTVGKIEGVAARAASKVKAGARRVEDKVRGASARADRRGRTV
ncbi:hypothetical protein BH11MYX1_BH11MYX1_40810 [soil metagenome]